MWVAGVWMQRVYDNFRIALNERVYLFWTRGWNDGIRGSLFYGLLCDFETIILEFLVISILW